jgi:hypothetical protein
VGRSRRAIANCSREAREVEYQMEQVDSSEALCEEALLLLEEVEAMRRKNANATSR